MWGFVDCTRYQMSSGVPQIVLFDASLIVGTEEKVALLIPPGQGKSTIMRMLGGLEAPDAGTVLRDDGGWPLGYSGGLRIEMTGDENVRNMAAFAGCDADELAAFTYEFSELGSAYFSPVSEYSSSMRVRLAFAASLGIPARTYLADDKVAAGDPRFREKTMKALYGKLQAVGLILVASNPRAAKDVCDQFFIVRNGQFHRADNYDEAAAMFAAAMESSQEDANSDDLPSFDFA